MTAFLRPEVLAFAHLMEAQLRANDHKPGWKGDTDLDLFERLGEEKAELLEALHRNAKRLMWGSGWLFGDTVPRVGREAADVANFAMMIADVCGALDKHAETAGKVEAEPEGGVKRTMTMTLTDAEIAALEEMIRKKDMAPPTIFRQALKTYQLLDHGWTLQEPPGWSVSPQPAPQGSDKHGGGE